MDKLPKERKTRSVFWHHFDRWALLLVVVLQAGILLSYRLRRPVPASSEPTPAGQTAGVAASDEAPATTVTQRSGGRTFATSPVCYENALRAPLSVDSACSLASWQVLRRSPALDIAERAGFFEVRLSVPEGIGHAALARVEGRELQIEVPAADGVTNRILRRVQLPAAPAGELPPRLAFTNGILRIVVSK